MPAGRRAFTLVELLVVMVIIAILSSMVLAGLYQANEAAKHSKTKGTIAKINGQLVDRWDAYRTRRLPIAMDPMWDADPNDPQQRPRKDLFERRRLLALWTLQRIEMPDTYEDIMLDPGALHPSFDKLRDNALQLVYQAHAPSPFTEHVSARCLYLMVTLGMDSNDEVRFLDSEVDDTDQNGVPDVFVDAWGRPIEWIRWAPGYLPRLGAATDFQRDDPPGSTAPLEGFQADPFDPRGVCRPGTPTPPNGTLNLAPPPGMPSNYGPPAHPSSPANAPPGYGFKLMPLVYSWGPDGESGIFRDADSNRATHPYAWHADAVGRAVLYRSQ